MYFYSNTNKKHLILNIFFALAVLKSVKKAKKFDFWGKVLKNY